MPTPELAEMARLAAQIPSSQKIAVSAHTLGPWRMSDHGDKRHREFAIMCDKGGKDGDGGRVASVYAGFGHHFTFEEAEAHARLIAAAPDLLASHMGDDLAKEIAGCLIGDTLTAFLEWRDLQCAAIALAEGKA